MAATGNRAKVSPKKISYLPSSKNKKIPLFKLFIGFAVIFRGNYSAMALRDTFKKLLLISPLCLTLGPANVRAQGVDEIATFKLRGTIFLQSKTGGGCSSDIAPSTVVNMLLVRQGDTIYTTSYGLRRATASDNSATFKFQPYLTSPNIKSFRNKLTFKNLHLNSVPPVFTYTTVYQDNSSC